MRRNPQNFKKSLAGLNKENWLALAYSIPTPYGIGVNMDQTLTFVEQNQSEPWIPLLDYWVGLGPDWATEKNLVDALAYADLGDVLINLQKWLIEYRQKFSIPDNFDLFWNKNWVPSTSPNLVPSTNPNLVPSTNPVPSTNNYSFPKEASGIQIVKEKAAYLSQKYPKMANVKLTKEMVNWLSDGGLFDDPTIQFKIQDISIQYQFIKQFPDLFKDEYFFNGPNNYNVLANVFSKFVGSTWSLNLFNLFSWFSEAPLNRFERVVSQHYHKL